MPTHKPSLTRKSTVPVSEEMARAIQMFQDRLSIEYGSDYSFTICGQGEILARHNIEGIVIPRVVAS